MITSLPKDYRDDVISAMGEGLGNLYLTLVLNLFNLDLSWKYYSLLFRVNEERVDLLNEWLGGIAAIIQDSMLDSVVMSIARICDRRSNDTSSIKRFSKKLDNREIFPKEISELCKEAFDLGSEAVKELRDKYIAHQNYAIYKDGQGYSYPPYIKIDEIILKLHCFVNTLAEFFKIKIFAPIVDGSYEVKVEKFFCKLSDKEYHWPYLKNVRQEWGFIHDFWKKCENESIQLSEAD